jgi:hypothetical protein
MHRRSHEANGCNDRQNDAAKKKEATTAVDMSKAAMKKGDTAGCMKHMDEAHKAMGLRLVARSRLAFH